MMSRPINREILLTSVMPHMHWLGKDFKFNAVLPDDAHTRIPLIEIDHWNFNWQGTYGFAKPIKLPKGTYFEMVAHFDNSENNPANPSKPPKVVRWATRRPTRCASAFSSSSPPKEPTGRRRHGPGRKRRRQDRRGRDVSEALARDFISQHTRLGGDSFTSVRKEQSSACAGHHSPSRGPRGRNTVGFDYHACDGPGGCVALAGSRPFEELSGLDAYDPRRQSPVGRKPGRLLARGPDQEALGQPGAGRHQRDVHLHLVLADGRDRALRPGEHGLLHRRHRRVADRQGRPLVHPRRHAASATPCGASTSRAARCSSAAASTGSSRRRWAERWPSSRSRP